MKARYLWAILSVVLSAGFVGCPPDPDPDPDGGPDGSTDGGDGGLCGGQFCTLLVEGADGGMPVPLAATILAGDTVAIAYYHRVGTDDQSNPILELRYRTVQGSTVSPEEVIDTDLRRFAGLSIARSDAGEISVAYLGGQYDPSTHAFWFQNDMYLATRTGPGSWNNVAVAVQSNEATGDVSPVSNAGFLVGLHPAVAFHGDEVYVAWRDCHNGQFPTQDWAGSDLEVGRGTVSNLAEKRIVIGADGTTVGKQGYGGHNQMIAVQRADGGTEVVIASDMMDDGADTIGANPSVFVRNSDASWFEVTLKPFPDISNTQSGPSIAYDSVQGFGIAAVDRSSNLLRYNRSANPRSWQPTQAENVVQSGTSGWYPSLAYDRQFHEPHIAYYHCDNRTSISENACRVSDDELRVIAKIGTVWRNTVVDREGGWQPKLFFLSNGKRALVYRDPRTFVVKVAVEP